MKIRRGKFSLSEEQREFIGFALKRWEYSCGCMYRKRKKTTAIQHLCDLIPQDKDTLFNI